MIYSSFKASTDIGDMSRRSRRLQERETSQDVDEGKTGDRRLSVGDVLGLCAPAGTPNLRTAQAVSAAEAAAATLDSYNADRRDDDENTIDDIDEKDDGSVSAEARARLAAPSMGHDM